MRRCRKIYNNLLLMSVLFFALAGAAQPHLCLECAGCGHAFAAHSCSGGDADGTLYQDGCTFSGYAAIHICGPVSGRVLLLPGGAEPLALTLRAPVSRRAPAMAAPRTRRDPIGPSRGPPGAPVTIFG